MSVAQCTILQELISMIWTDELVSSYFIAVAGIAVAGLAVAGIYSVQV